MVQEVLSVMWLGASGHSAKEFSITLATTRNRGICIRQITDKTDSGMNNYLFAEAAPRKGKMLATFQRW